MAQRRCLHKLIRHCSNLLSSAPSSLKTLPRHLQKLTISAPLNRSIPYSQYSSTTRHFSSKKRDDTDEEDFDDDVEDDDDEESSDGEGNEMGNESVSNCEVNRVYSVEEKAKAAAEIGYTVIGPLQRSDRVYKDYEPAFAVVQIGSHQFKVSNGDCIYTERLKFCEVNDKLILNKVLLLGTSAQTIVGRPILPDAAVHAIVEEHALDAKVIIFKKKRRKNYRRTKGHRQELTKLRITSVEGIEIPKTTVPVKPEKTTSVKTEKATSGKIEKAAPKKSENIPIAA